MIPAVLLEGGTQVIQAQVPFDHIGLGTIIQGVMFVLACAGFYFNFRKHRNETEKNTREAEDRIIGALKADITEKHRSQSEDVATLDKRVGKMEDRSENYLSENKIKSMVSETCEDLKHKLNGERTRVDALERFRNQDIERIVRLETNMASIEKSVAKIEHSVENLGKDLGARIDGWADKLATSIREVRDVKPRNG